MTTAHAPHMSDLEAPAAESSGAPTSHTLVPPMLGGVLAVLGLGTWIVGFAVHSSASGQFYGGGTSLFGQLFPLWHADTWVAFPFLMFALAVVAALVAALRPAARSLAAGALVGLALEAYLLAFPALAIRLKFDGPGVASFTLLTVGAALVAGGGQLLYARAERAAAVAPDRRTGLPAAAVAVATLAAFALLVSAVLPVYPDGQGGAYSPLGLDGALRWYAVEPLGLGLGGLALVGVALGGLDRVAAGGALAGLGLLASTAELSLVVQTGSGDLSVQTGGWIALVAAVALAVAGALALVTGSRGSASGRPRAALVRAAVDEPTRLLSAAAHLDFGFAERAVRDVLRERHRALAPTSGVALGEVLRHCLAARSRRRARNLLLAGVTAPLLVAIANGTRGILVAVLLLTLLWIIVLTELWTARYRVAARHLSAGADHKPPEYLPPGAEAIIRDIEVSEARNLIVYSGYRPWVGSGAVQGGWTFAVNVRKGKESPAGRLEARAFAEGELHDYVADRLLATELPTLQLSDRLFVDGQHVRDDRRFLEDRFSRPRTTLTQAELEAADADGPPEVLRRVRSASVTSWAGEVTFTVFLDFRLEGVSLYADATYCSLTPPDAAYRRVDGIDPRPPLGERLRVAAEAAKQTVALPLAAVRALRDLPNSWGSWRRRSRERREISRNPRFDYGATTSLRELAQASGYRRYFQWIDRDMFAKILEREILDAIVTFLDEHDIDTTDLEERQAAVLNNGVIVTGGALSAQSLAVGTQARSAVVEGARRVAASAAGKARS